MTLNSCFSTKPKVESVTTQLRNPFRVEGIDEYRRYPPGSMHFSQYATLQEGLKAHCGAFYAEFPFAAMILDKAIRSLAFGHIEFHNQKISRCDRVGLPKQAFFCLAQLAGGRADCGSNGTFFTSLNGFDWLGREIEAKLTAMGLQSIGPQKALGIRRKKQLQALATKGRAYEATLELARNVGIDKVIENQPLMRRLNDEVHHNIEILKQQIIKHRIRLFLCNGDASDHARVFCHAAQSLGVPYVVVAHGYVQHYALLTIAPINADALIVWTDEQARAIRAAIEPYDAAKIHYFGYPKPLWPKTTQNRHLAGIIWHPIFHMPDRSCEIAQLAKVAREIGAQGFDIILRLHPKDRLDQDLTGRLEQTGLRLSDGSIEDDLGPASVIVGSRSSVLVEAALSGKPVFQIEEHRLNHLESVRQISIHNPRFGATIASAEQTMMDKATAFDFDGFARFLAEKMRNNAPGPD